MYGVRPRKLSVIRGVRIKRVSAKRGSAVNKKSDVFIYGLCRVPPLSCYNIFNLTIAYR